APFGVGPAGFLTRATPRISTQELADLHRTLAQRPDLSQVQKANEAKPSAPELTAANAAPAAQQSAKLDPQKSIGPLSAKLPDLSGIQPTTPADLTFNKVITTAPTSYSGPTRPTYYWNRVSNATSYRIETIDSNGFQHEFV